VTIGFVSGVAVGGWLAQPDAEPASVAALSPASVSSPEPSAILQEGDPGDGAQEVSEALMEAWLTNFWLSGRVQSMESLIEDLEAQDVDPALLARGVISKLDRDELQAAISMATQLGAEDLAEIQDMDAFAERLTEIAMEGTMVDDQGTVDAPDVWFGGDASALEDPSMETNGFDLDQARIDAFFSAGDYSGTVVMVKWYRTDEPKIMLFKRHSISSGREADYVWLEPSAGWQSGEYQVDIYTGDEAMNRLAVGRYSVR
jgi:hypothetical protein